MKLFDKKAIELSVNFLVTFILAIVVFGAGMFILRGMINNAESTLDLTQKDLDARINQLSCSSKEAMCLSNNDASTQRGKAIIFGVTINNYLTQATKFKITTQQITGIGKDGQEINIALDENQRPNLFPKETSTEVEAKSSQTTAMGINVPKATIPGTYSFVVKVEPEEQNTGFAPVSKRLTFKVN
jgi:hypothetical protein